MANIDPTRLAASLRRLEPATELGTAGALRQVVDACEELFQVTGSGLLIADQDNQMRATAATNGQSRALEDVQAETGQGPCVDAFVNREIVTTDDLARESRWPASRDTLVGHDVRAVLAVPVVLGGVTVGALDVYMDQPYHWDESQKAALSRYSDVVEVMLNAALKTHDSSELADQLQYALDYRAVIERGIGYVMATYSLDPVDAFNLLRRTARDQRRKVSDVAQELLSGGTTLPRNGSPSTTRRRQR
jgi:transcriptional regulator with GAF, ATPase, and Fis domain